jgi:hypothetical protein
MGTRDEAFAKLSRRLGWGLLAGVLLSWGALALWIGAHPCPWGCEALYWLQALSFPPVPVGVAVWAVSLSGLPVAALFLESSYRTEQPAVGDSTPATAVANVLYVFGFGAVFLSGFSLFLLPRSTGTTAVLSVAGLFWFPLVGICTLVAARRLNDVVRRTRAPARRLWVTAGVLWFVGAVAPNVFAASYDPYPSIIPEPDMGPPIVRPPREKPSQVATPTPTPSPSASRSPLPKPPPVHLLPVAMDDERSGYDMQGRIQVRPSGHASLGRQYTVVLNGRWAAPGSPQDQVCTYTFFDEEGAVVRRRSAPFGFYTGGRRVENLNHLTFFESQMRGDAARAEIECRDAPDD